MVISAGQAFLFVFFYLIALLAARASRRPFYKRMWKAAAFVLGLAITFTAAWYIFGLFAVLLAI